MTLTELAYITQSSIEFHQTDSRLGSCELTGVSLDRGGPAIAYGESKAEAKKNLVKRLRCMVLVKHYAGDIGRWEFPVPRTLAA